MSPPIRGCRKMRGDLAAARQHRGRVLRQRKLHQPGFLRRIDDDHLPAPIPARLQLVHEARMVRGRIRADHEDRIAAVEVLQLDRRRACPDRSPPARRWSPGGNSRSSCGRCSSHRPAPAAAAGSPPRSTTVPRSRRTSGPASPPQSAPLRSPSRDPTRRLVPVLALRLWSGKPSRPRCSSSRPDSSRSSAMRMSEYFFRDRRLHVGRLRLHRLVADGGKIAELVGHAPALTAHAEPARLARILRRSAPWPPCRRPCAGRCIACRAPSWPAAADGRFGHGARILVLTRRVEASLFGPAQLPKLLDTRRVT